MIAQKLGEPATRHTRPACAFCRRRHGLSLLELVIVLGLLAVLAATAIRSLQPVADQGRYEATRKLIEDCRAAIVGDPGLRDERGAILISGALADIGADDKWEGIIGENLIAALPPSGVTPFQLWTVDSDGDGTKDVTLGGGWKGPYMRLGVGRTQLTDGWGRRLILDYEPVSQTIIIASLGSDGDSVGAELGYEQDIVETISRTDYEGTVIFQSFYIDPVHGRVPPDLDPVAREAIGIRFYGVNANGGSGGEIEQQFLAATNLDSFEVQRHNTLHGSVAARALVWQDRNNNGQIDSVNGEQEPIVRKSPVYYLTVFANQVRRVQMDLREVDNDE